MEMNFCIHQILIFWLIRLVMLSMIVLELRMLFVDNYLYPPIINSIPNYSGHEDTDIDIWFNVRDDTLSTDDFIIKF